MNRCPYEGSCHWCDPFEATINLIYPTAWSDRVANAFITALPGRIYEKLLKIYYFKYIKFGAK